MDHRPGRTIYDYFKVVIAFTVDDPRLLHELLKAVRPVGSLQQFIPRPASRALGFGAEAIHDWNCFVESQFMLHLCNLLCAKFRQRRYLGVIRPPSLSVSPAATLGKRVE